MKGVLIRGCTLGGVGSSSVYCSEGRVAKVAPGGEISVPDGTWVIDAGGGEVLPGLADSHCHPFEYGRLKRSIDLRGTTNMTGVRLRLSAAVQRSKPGEWVTGRGWDQEAFPGRKMPDRSEIDGVSGSNPVALSRVCGHIALVNSRAIEALGIADRVGEGYERDGGGRLTGIVKEGAVTEALAAIERSPERSAADLQAVEAEAARLGLTALHSILSQEGFKEELGALGALAGAGSLSLRYRVYIPPESMGYVKENGLRERLERRGVRINGVKIYADGSLGARTAALFEPYSDDPSNTGILRHSDEEMAELVEKVDSSGYQAVIHAIGDRAVDQAIGCISRVSGAKNPRRHRIEHASLLPRDLRGRMARHGIRAAVQPLFVTSDAWASDRLGEERVRDLYPFRSMMEDGIVTSGSSDSPVESLSPVLGVWAAITRGGSVPAESLDLDQALALYVANAASNAFDPPRRGVEEGMPADLTVLDSAVGGMHPALLRKVGVLATMVGGAVAHSYGGP